jgi:CelD/BcsL family acetyltransferase involved in cellulose biosynthesis
LLNVEVVPAGSLTADQLDRWSQIRAADPAFSSPFFCPQFTGIVAAVRDDVHVGVLARDGHAFGFFPFHLGRFRTGRPVGWAISDYQGVVAERDEEWDAKDLIRACGLKTWEFDHAIAAQRQLQPFGHTKASSPVIDLSAGFDTYLQERRKAGVHEIAAVWRKMRKLEREHGALRFESSAADPEAMSMLLGWKRQQYLRTGVRDVLAWSWVREVLELARAARDERFGGLLSLLYAGDQLVAAHFGLRSGSVWHYWFPAYDPQFGKYSPGIALLLKMAEHAPLLGLEAIDLGKGDARYKDSLASNAVPLIEGRVELPSVATAAARLRRGTRRLVRRTSLARPTRRLVRRTMGRRADLRLPRGDSQD